MINPKAPNPKPKGPKPKKMLNPKPLIPQAPNPKPWGRINPKPYTLGRWSLLLSDLKVGVGAVSQFKVLGV